MAEQEKFLTTGEFSTLTGISASVIGRMLREGKLKGIKSSGKWKIPESELQSKIIQSKKKGGAQAGLKTSQEPAQPDISPAGKTYTVSEFAEMTYLTEYGVEQWLKSGRLTGQRNEQGEWLVDARNLKNPQFKRLIRE